MAKEIKSALKEADAGDFASEEEVRATINGGGAVRIKWPRRAEKNLEQEAEYIAPEDPEAVLGWFNVLSTASKN